MNEQLHEMVLEKVHSSGAEEWFCSACGRSILLNWEPKFKRIVLEAGDELIPHSGSKSDLSLETLQFLSGMESAQGNEADLLIDDERLNPWLAWMDKIDFEKLWKE